MVFREIFGSWLHYILMIWLIGAAAAVPSEVRANVGTLSESADLKLTPCIRRVAVGDNAAMLINQSSRFDCMTDQKRFGPGNYWVRIAVPMTDDEAFTVIRWKSLWQSHTSVDASYSDGTVSHYDVPATGSGRFVRIGGYYTVALRRDATPTTLLFRVSGSANMRGIFSEPHLQTGGYAAMTETKRGALYGVFAGICLALLAYNFMIWRALRERYLLAYCAMLIACVLYAATSSAIIAQMAPSIDNNVRLQANYFALSAVLLCGVWFAKSFLGEHRFSPLFNRLIVAFGAATLVIAVAIAVFAPWQLKLLDRAFLVPLTALFILASAVLAEGWRNGSRLDRLFVAVWMVPLALNSGRMLHSFGLVPNSFWLDNATLIGFGVEALLSSMLIGHRIRMMQVDRDLARAEEAVARQQADTDMLTGLSNRRALMRSVCPPPDRAGLYRLVIVDVDHFKRINDAVGHSAGDKVLQHIAQMINDERRPGAVAARLGGEEFAIVYPTTISDRRYHTGLLDRVRGLPPIRGQRVSVSMGAATGWLSGSESDWLSLYRAADEALYAAKSGGRDRLVIAELYAEVRAQAA
jgi:diguanylate cyclase (GGDEF)-like protein